MEAIQALMVNNLNKVINCYCEDCVGRSSIALAPKLFEARETPLKDPFSCMCYSCMKNFKWKKYPVKRRAPEGLVFKKAKKITGHYLMRTKGVEFFELGEHKDEDVNLTLMKFRNKQYGASIRVDKLRKMRIDETLPIYSGTATYFKSSDDGTWTHDSIYSPKKIKDNYICLPFYTTENAYFHNGIKVTFILCGDISESVYRLYKTGILRNILYHDEEYLGYRCRYNPEEEYYFIYKCDNRSSAEGPGDIIRSFREVPSEEIIDEIEYHGYNPYEVFRALDLYCYECSKYKASCLGHSSTN
jgi:hypothetical protein